MAKNTLTKFICWFGGFQRIKKAKDLSDLFNRMTKKEKEIWNNISFIENNHLIKIDSESIEGGWTFEDCRRDSIENLTTEDKEDFLDSLEILQTKRF